MSEFDEKLRILLEKHIDDVLEDPEVYEEVFKKSLMIMGIEPNLETILAHSTGIIMGRLLTRSRMTAREMNQAKIVQDAWIILRRRAYEMREAFLSTRIG